MYLKRRSWISVCVLVQQFLSFHCQNFTLVENEGTSIYGNEFENEIVETAKALTAQPQFQSLPPHSSEAAELNSVHSDLKCDRGQKCEPQISSSSAYESTHFQTQTPVTDEVQTSLTSKTQSDNSTSTQTFKEHTTDANVDLITVAAEKDTLVPSHQTQTFIPSVITEMQETYETMSTAGSQGEKQTNATSSSSHETQTMSSNTYYSHTHSANNMTSRNITWSPVKFPENSSSQSTTSDESDGNARILDGGSNMSSTLGYMVTDSIPLTTISISPTLPEITNEKNVTTNQPGSLYSVETTSTSTEQTDVSFKVSSTNTSYLPNSTSEENLVIMTTRVSLLDDDMAMQYLSPIEHNTTKVRDLSAISTTLTSLNDTKGTVSSDVPGISSTQTTTSEVVSMLTGTEKTPTTIDTLITSDYSEIPVHSNSSDKLAMTTMFIDESVVSTEIPTHAYNESVSTSLTVTEGAFTGVEMKDTMRFSTSTSASSTLNSAEETTEARSSIKLTSVQETQESTTAIYAPITNPKDSTTQEPVYSQSSHFNFTVSSETLDTELTVPINNTLGSTTEVTANDQVITETLEPMESLSITSSEVTSKTFTLNLDEPSTMSSLNTQSSEVSYTLPEHPQTSEEKETIQTHATQVTIKESDLETATYITVTGSDFQDSSTIEDMSNETVIPFMTTDSKDITIDTNTDSNPNNSYFAHHTTIISYKSTATESSPTDSGFTKTEDITLNYSDSSRYSELETTASVPRLKDLNTSFGSPSEPSTISSDLTTLIFSKSGASTEAGPTVYREDNNNTVTSENLSTSIIHRGGKNIPFNKSSIYFSESTHPTFTTDMSLYSVSTYREHETTMKKESEIFISQIKAEDLTRKEEANVITAIIQLPQTNYSQEMLDEKTLAFHLWLFHTIMKGSLNKSVNISESSHSETDGSAYEALPSITYILPTPIFNAPNLTFSFVVHDLLNNKTLLAESLIMILRIYSYQLHSEINTSNTFFLKGYLSDMNKPDWLEAIMGRNGVIILTTCLITVGIIVLLILAVVHYRIKHRQSVHCITDVDKLHRNIQEAVGIDLNPAIIILQDEINEKSILSNGDKTCAVDDDEGWLVPITDVPLAEDNSAASVQDTKL